MTVYKGKIAGDLTLYRGDDAKAVTSIGGSLYVSEGATCDLPAVTSIGGSIYVRSGATCDLPAVTSIGGSPVPDPETARARLVAVAEAALTEPGNLNMKVWHDQSKGCGTSHCIAGWAVHLEPDGYALEKKLGSTLTAGNVLLGPVYSKLFFLSDDDGRSALHRVLNGQEPLPLPEPAPVPA